MLSIYCLSATVWAFLVFFTNNEARKFDTNVKMYFTSLIPVINTVIVVVSVIMILIGIVNKIKEW